MSKSATITSREEFGITRLNSRHPEIRRLKRESDAPSIHGNKFWGSSHLLMDYLEENPIKHGSKVMELGCGWGLASIYCAKTFKAKVTGVDADPAVFPYLDLHAKINKVKVTTEKARFEKLTKQRLSEVDVLIGADICFWDSLSDTLFKLIRRATKAGVKKIIIADPERSPFFELSDRCMEEFYAELEERSIKTPKKASGALLIIENA